MSTNRKSYPAVREMRKDEIRGYTKLVRELIAEGIPAEQLKLGIMLELVDAITRSEMALQAELERIANAVESLKVHEHEY